MEPEIMERTSILDMNMVGSLLKPGVEKLIHDAYGSGKNYRDPLRVVAIREGQEDGGPLIAGRLGGMQVGIKVPFIDDAPGLQDSNLRNQLRTWMNTNYEIAGSTLYSFQPQGLENATVHSAPEIDISMMYAMLGYAKQRGCSNVIGYANGSQIELLVDSLGYEPGSEFIVEKVENETIFYQVGLANRILVPRLQERDMCGPGIVSSDIEFYTGNYVAPEFFVKQADFDPRNRTGTDPRRIIEMGKHHELAISFGERWTLEELAEQQQTGHPSTVLWHKDIAHYSKVALIVPHQSILLMDSLIGGFTSLQEDFFETNWFSGYPYKRFDPEQIASQPVLPTSSKNS